MTRVARRSLLLAVAAGALAGCGPASLQPSRDVIMDRPDAAATPGPDAADPFVPGPCVEPAVDPPLARFQTGVIGGWMGTATAPEGWAWSRATVEFTFFCDGHYHARCLAAQGIPTESCRALYYGTDSDAFDKTYRIYDVRSDGRATGDIVIYFEESGTTTNDRLEWIDLGADGNTLSFDLIHLDEYGPIHYDLVRAGPSP